MRNAEFGMRNSVKFGEWRVELSSEMNLWRGAGAPSPPSEEGGGTAIKD